MVKTHTLLTYMIYFCLFQAFSVDFLLEITEERIACLVYAIYHLKNKKDITINEILVV